MVLGPERPLLLSLPNRLERRASEVALPLFDLHGTVLVVVDDAVGALGVPHAHQLLNDLGNRVGIGADCAGAGTASQRTQAARDPLFFAGQTLHEWLLHGNQAVAAHQHAPRLCKVERNNRDFLEMDVVPDVELSPVGQWEDADAFARADAAIEEAPQFGALSLRIPLARAVAEGEDAFLGARLFFVAARAAKRGVKAVCAQSIEQSLRLQQTAAALR